MADEIARLIAEITHLAEFPSPSPTARPSRTGLARSRRITGFRIWGAASVVVLAVVATLTLTRPQAPGSPEGSVASQTIAPRATVTAVRPERIHLVTDDVPTPASQSVADAPRSVHHSVASTSRRAAPAISNAVLEKSLALPAARAVSELQKPTVSRSSIESSPHFAGAALQRALAEDRIVTRQFNLARLRADVRTLRDANAAEGNRPAPN